MQERSKKILQAIIEQHLLSAEPVGSKTLLVSYDLGVSPATIRNEMAKLEDSGYLMQPHTSSGRIPTDLGYRFFVNDLVDFQNAKQQSHALISKIQNDFKTHKLKKEIQNAVTMLSNYTNNITFATLPDSATFYLGISKMLKKPEFMNDPLTACQVIEVFEKNNQFLKYLQNSEVPEGQIQISIGHENLLEEIKSCSIIVTRYRSNNFIGYIGILGPTRMNYAVNSIVLEEVTNQLNQEI
ncbi:hypothetical protein HOH51_01715 [bacterium]|jgi:heat-inducible transcriptional repressor|nr:hypothetical protein [bacterium]